MSKALMGYVGQPPAYMILRELNALKARVAELERHLADAEQELALREVEDFRTSTTKEAALAEPGFVDVWGLLQEAPNRLPQISGIPGMVGCPC
jgi:hypothetical protein